MYVRIKCLFAILLALVGLLPSSAQAQITAAFYSHELGNSFPHAFIVLKGTPLGGGPPVDLNFGFTAKSVSPAILMGPVVGVIESAKPGYIRNSDRKFSLPITDAQYAALMALSEEWRTRPGKSYDLNKRNCVHFVGEAAKLLGLKVAFDKKLMKRPRSFLENVIKLNPGLGNP